MKNLRQLDLGHNELKRIPTEIFENLSNLTSFSLENNPLITLESDQFSSFVKLKTLNLMKTSLDDFPPLQTENNVCKYSKISHQGSWDENSRPEPSDEIRPAISN